MAESTTGLVPGSVLREESETLMFTYFQVSIKVFLLKERITVKKNDVKVILNAVKWVLFWMALALIFNGFIYYIYGHEKGVEFLAGYLIELSLSIDNLFVFITIFTSFGLTEHAQHRVLRWGIICAIIMRFFFIFFGIKLVHSFEWILYVFGAILIISGIRMYGKEKESKNPHEKLVVKGLKRVMPMTEGFEGEKFFVKKNRIIYATPLFAVLLIIESSDILFAIDSVPAVFSVSTDLLIVYSSNIFAILGLRQLYFILLHLHDRFSCVKYGVATILIFTGLKMLGSIMNYHIDNLLSIAIIVGVLAVSIIASIVVSMVRDKKQSQK